MSSSAGGFSPGERHVCNRNGHNPAGQYRCQDARHCRVRLMALPARSGHLDPLILRIVVANSGRPDTPRRANFGRNA